MVLEFRIVTTDTRKLGVKVQVHRADDTGKWWLTDLLDLKFNVLF